MGQKVNAIGLRLGINRTWDSRWFASRGEYGKLLHEDMRIRDHIMKQRRQGGISKVVIERPHKKCRVTVHTARPGVLIGKKGCLLYTSDAADEEDSVDLGGRRIIKKKKKQ